MGSLVGGNTYGMISAARRKEVGGQSIKPRKTGALRIFRNLKLCAVSARRRGPSRHCANDPAFRRRPAGTSTIEEASEDS